MQLLEDKEIEDLVFGEVFDLNDFEDYLKCIDEEE